ncbi:MAG: AMP-binding protein, partial [Ignavibacteriae bacterium]|nr:AMP-binding protein [Ignavibacteriota bacterium]
SSEELVKVLKSLNITTVTLPPSVLSVIPKEYASELENLKTIIVAGEKCSSELANRWSMNRQFVNAYGPTETTVCASMFTCPNKCEVNPPIGKSINNFQLYILDKNLIPVPVGIPGELYISGVGLARGYHNKPELSAEKFLPNPFSSKPGDKIYKSGDLVKYLPSGDIEFLGRVDNQVKLRGFRIELDEIESVISSYVQVNEALVMVREDSPGLKQLVTYMVSSKNVSIDLAELRTFLRSKLPEYMVPVSYIILEEFPLTPSKKIDLKALPIPDSSHKTVKAEYVQPRNETEKIISEIGKELLGIDRMGIYDNFFELGGHSLLATQFISKIQDEFKVEIPLRKLFENPTINDIGNIMENLSEIKIKDDIIIKGESEPSITDLLSEITNISDDEVIELLKKEKDI